MTDDKLDALDARIDLMESRLQYEAALARKTLDDIHGILLAALADDERDQFGDAS